MVVVRTALATVKRGTGIARNRLFSEDGSQHSCAVVEGLENTDCQSEDYNMDYIESENLLCSLVLIPIPR